MNIFIHIGTRKGSKGLKNKNLLILKNKKLIEHTILFVKRLNFKKKIIINTDDEKVIKIAKKMKINFVIKRPKNLSTSKASKFSAWKYAAEWLIKQREMNIKKDILLDLDNTCPLRKKKDIEKMLIVFKKKYYKNKKIDCLFTVTKARRNPYFQLMEYNSRGLLEISKKIKGKTFVRRQDIPKVYEHCGVAYFFKPQFLIDKRNFLDGNLKGYEIDRISSMDIDDKEALEIVSRYFK